MTELQLRDLTRDDLRQFAVLARISRMLNEAQEPERVLQRALEMVVATLDAERACILLLGHDGSLEVALQSQASAGPFDFSRTIVDQVLSSGKGVLSHDAVGDARFTASQSIKRMHARSIMCVPIRLGGRTTGLIYVDNLTVAGLFVVTDLALLEIVADMVASALERAQYVKQLVRTEKLAVLGTLVAGIAHEICSPLSAIVGFAELAATETHEPETVREMCTTIGTEAQRCHQMVRELLRSARENVASHRSVDLRALAERLRKLARQEFVRDDVDLSMAIDDDAPDVHGDADQLLQVMLNLLTNARLAVRDSALRNVSLRVSRDGDAVRMEVRDSGPGIAPEAMPRIFEPFFTTREEGTGTGLGLSIVERIVTEHGGAITAENAPSGGAVFVVTLPLA